MAQWSNTFNGSGGGNYRLTLNVDLVSQSTSGDSSVVSVSAWVTKLSGSGYYSQSGSSGHININGNNMSRSFGNYDFRSQGTYYFAQNEQYTMYHDNQGNGTFYFGADYNLNNTPGSSSTGGNDTLPQIPRYASIPYFNITTNTDAEIDFNWGSSDNVDYISWWSTAYDGGGHHDTPASGTGSFAVQLPNLKSNTQYDITVAVRRQSSGLWTNSGTAYPTTLSQSGFADGGGL